MPRSLDLNRLRQFAPASSQSVEDVIETKLADQMPAVPMQGEVAQRWPSREPIRDGQISIKAPLDVIERFRAMCRDDRRTYTDMLGILMDAHGMSR